MKISQTLQLLALALAPILFTSCVSSIHYSANTLLDETSLHHEIAIVPVEINFSGNLSARLTDDDFRQLDIQESHFYQESLYNSLLRKAHKNVKVDIQSIERTNAILKEQKISVHDSWAMDPAELADILKVDAVVKVRIEESRYLSNAAGFGIELGRAVIFGPYSGPLPAGPVKTADVRASCSIFDGDSGDLLWKIGVDQDANWSYTPTEIIESLNRRIARKFPYKW